MGDCIMADSKNIIRDLIFTCIEISKRSKVPFLFISNPGYGKTTSINLYAKTFGYHVETLIGSHYSQDEILGFQANTGKNQLTILKPEWYSRIMYASSKNVPSILFLDELSTVSPNVQGALLQLCFERKIRGGNSLPEDCIVIAAANYKQNLPGFSDIIAPELNRFCIINILPDGNKSLYANSLEIINEFTQDFKEVKTNLPKFNTDVNFTKDQNEKFLEETRKRLVSLIDNHSTEAASSNSIINFRNVSYDGIYDRMDGIPEVYNFISPRTISYYMRVVRTICEMGIKTDNIVIKKIVEGLLGLGTNTFSSDDECAMSAQIRFLQTELFDMTVYLINKFTFSEVPNPVPMEISATFNNNTLSGYIKNYISEHDTHGVKLTPTLTMLGKNIALVYNTTSIKECTKILYQNKSQFRSDYESIRILYDFLSKKMKKSNENKLFLSGIMSVINCFEPVYKNSFSS